MSDELKHECGVAMVVLKKPPAAAGDYGGTKLSLLLEKQHNRGQDGAGAAILRTRPVPGEEPYWIAKSASSTPLADVLGAIARRGISRGEKDASFEDVRQETGYADDSSRASSLASSFERIFLGHLRYATFGKNEAAFCHPFVHESSELAHTLLLAGNFNLTNAHELFDDYARHGSFPTSKSDGYLVCELIAHELFHCITRHSPEFRQKMYSLIGFTVMDHDIEFPERIRRRIMANPDVEHIDNYAEFTIDGVKRKCTLVTYYTSSWKEARISKGPTTRFFDNIRVVLLPLDELDHPYKISDATDFWEKMGRNTTYINAPEECLAVNFSYAIVYGPDEDYKSPQLIRSILSALQ